MTIDNTAIAAAQVTLQANQLKPIGPDLFVIFFEDINYLVNGGWPV